MCGQHLAPPQHIIDDEQPAGPHLADDGLKVRVVVPLVGINKDQVPDFIDQARQNVERRPDVQPHLRTNAGRRHVAPDARLPLRLNFNGMQHPVGGQPFGQTQRGIPAKRTDFQNAARAHEVAQHTQQAALHMPAAHARHQELQVGFAGELGQQRRLGGGVEGSVGFGSVGHIQYYLCCRGRSRNTNT